MRALQSQANLFLPAAMSDRPSLGKSEEQKSLRELSVALTSFAESQSQIKCIFSLYDHDSDGFLTTDQTTLLMRKLGYAMPSAWAYVYRDAVTLPLVSNMPHARASLPAPLDALLQLSQFVLGQLLEKQKEQKTSKAHLRAIDQFCVMNSDPKSIILEPQLVAFLTDMGIQASGRRFACSVHCQSCNASPSPAPPAAAPLPHSYPAGHAFTPQRHDETCQHKVRRRFPPDFKTQKRFSQTATIRAASRWTTCGCS